MVLLHNDAVVQGLSEAPFMTDVTHWGALTIGTGLGNARFTNRKPADEIARLDALRARLPLVRVEGRFPPIDGARHSRPQ